jgi:methionyl-tRNA formyltransferase
MNIAFFSSSYFTLPILEAIFNSGKLKLVVSSPEKENRGKKVINPILEFARKNSIEIWTPENINKELTTELDEIDLVITASYGQFLGKKVLSKTKNGFLNWHPSKLPAHRGASPIQSALINGETTTALSWIDMTSEMDAGLVYLQTEIPIKASDNFTTLAKRFGELGVQTWEQAVKNKLANKGGIQDETKATFCTKITKEQATVDPKTQTAGEIANHFRAFIEFPGTSFTDTKFGQIKILDCKEKTYLGEEVVAENITMIGNWLINKTNRVQEVYLRCSNKSLLTVKKIQLATGKTMNFQGYNF